MRGTSRRVLVTGGEERSVLGAVRCLAAHGWAPTVTAHERPAVAQWSRACAARVRTPDPRADPERFVSALERVVAAVPHAALIAGTDAALTAVSERRGRLESHVRIGLPPPCVVATCLDKQALAEAAPAAGLAAPVGRVCAGEAEALAAAEELGYPVVVKPRRSVLAPVGGRRADGPEDVRALLGRGECLVQRVEEGDLHSCSGAMAAGRLRAVGVSRYLRTWPPAAGNAAAAVTVAPDPALVGAVERLLAGLGWQGLFELELIRAAGRWVALDLNPRPFGSSALVAAAGAPLAAIWCDWLTGGDPEWAEARPGLHYRWEDADARNALRRLRDGDLRGAAAVLRPHRRTVHAHFRAGDPAPLLARAIYLSRRALR